MMLLTWSLPLARKPLPIAGMTKVFVPSFTALLPYPRKKEIKVYVIDARKSLQKVNHCITVLRKVSIIFGEVNC